MKAVLDRYEGNLAVLILGDTNQRLNVPAQLIPIQAKAGDLLEVEIQNDQLLTAVLNDSETAIAAQRIADKLAHLRRGDQLKRTSPLPDDPKSPSP